MLKCRSCGQVKDDSAFHLRGDNIRRSECGTCRNESRRKPKPILRSEREPIQIQVSEDGYTKTATLPSGRVITEQLKQNNAGQHKAELVESGNSAIATTVSTRIKSLEQLLEACSVDLSTWFVQSHTCNAWESYSGQDGITTLYQVKAQLQRIKAIATEWPEIHPVRVSLPAMPASKPSIAVGLIKTLVIPDSQNGFLKDTVTGKLTPMHDVRCWDLALQLASETQPDNIILLGDMLDFCELGRYTYTPEFAYTTQATINDLAQTLAKFRLACPQAKIVWLEGNHELRLQRSICENLKAAYGLTQANSSSKHPVMSIPHLLGLDDLRIDYISGYPDSIYWLTPKLACIHGYTAKQGGGETAKAMLKDLNYSVVYGHVHRQELKALTVHTHAGIEIRYAFSPGTIARLDGTVPSVNKRVDWQQGLSIVEHDAQDFSVEMIAIQEGSMIYRGQRFTAN